MKGALLEARGLGFAYGEERVLDGVDLAIAAGEQVAIIGPNGAGKTTLLRALCGLLEVPSGEVLLAGEEVSGMSRRRVARKVAYVPQSGGRHLPFTVAEFVAMGRYPHLSPFGGLGSDDRAAVARALETTGMAVLAERLMGSLSGGERQRLFIAAALAQGAELLLLDEPTTFLDPRHEQEVQRVLARVNREAGTTLVSVTHDLNWAARQADRVLALESGRVHYVGPAEGILDNRVLEPLYGRSFTFVNHPAGGRVIVPE